MILERAILSISIEQTQEFEQAFERAKLVISRSKGFNSLQLLRSVETPSSYLLLVDWDRVEDHMEGFRKSPDYEEWRSIIGGFFSAPPEVEHFEKVSTVG